MAFARYWMMIPKRRLLVVYNPRSSKHKRVEKEVLGPARKLRGFLVGKYEIKPTNADDNAESLAQILQDGDLVVSAGGDGTATIALNAVVLSGKDVTYGVLPYGNFNDFSRMLKTKKFFKLIDHYKKEKVRDFYPLDLWVDGEHFRYAACYFTLGMFAEATTVFDEPRVREKLKKGRDSLVFSVWALVKWYFKYKRADFLPRVFLSGRLSNGEVINRYELRDGVTDILLVNGQTVARVMKGKKWGFLPESFLIGTGRNRHLLPLVWFMVRNMIFKIRGEEMEVVRLDFSEATAVMIQGEGEYKRKCFSSLEVKKTNQAVKVVV